MIHLEPADARHGVPERAAVVTRRAHHDLPHATVKGAHDDAFEVLVDAEKVRDAAGNHLADIVVTFRVKFPAGDRGETARALLPDAVKKSHDRLCTVSRTVELGTPIGTRIES